MKYESMHGWIRAAALAALSAAACGTASAQEPTGGISQQIEVTKQYVPEVEGARKLDFEPRMGDTVTLKPDIRYSITPTPWKSFFGTKPIEAVGISTAEYVPERPAYLRIGLGYPLQSVADFYADTRAGRDGRIGFYLNHELQWDSSDRNFYRDRAGMVTQWTENRAGVHGAFALGGRRLDAALDYGFRYYVPFGKLVGDVFLSEPLMYHDASVELAYGDTFTDFSRFNYRIGLQGGITAGIDGAFESLPRITVDTGWRLGPGVMTLGAAFEGWFAGAKHDWYVGLHPEYGVTLGKLCINAGLKLYYDNYYYDRNADGKSEGNVFVLPEVGVSYSVADAFVPYVLLDGDMADGGFGALSRINPYVISGTSVNRPKSASLSGGFRGDAAQRFSYDVHVEYKDAQLPVFELTGNNFRPDLLPVGWFSAGADFMLAFPFGLSIEAGGKYNSLSSGSMFWSGTANEHMGTGIPDFEIGGTIGYCLEDKFRIRVGADYVGSRMFMSSGVLETVNPYVNLHADAQFKVNGKLAVFLVGDNLLNQKIYRYLYYPELGMNFMVGIKAVF